MAEKKKRELYSFNIDIDKEVEEEVIKEVKRKNKKTGKMEKVEETTIRTKIKEIPVKIILKKPTRTQIEDGDMFYSIWLNKFIKMGLLTRAMLAKKQVDVGGTLNEDDKMNYAKLYLKLFEKQQNIIRYSAKGPDDMSPDEKERFEGAVAELGIIRKQLADFEAAQASIFDHTADVKARNKTITWFLLHLAFVEEGEGDEEEVLMRPLFSGSEYEERYTTYQELDEEEDEIFLKAIDKLSTVATIWYMSGTQDQDEFDAVLDQIQKDNEAPEDFIPESPSEETEEEAEEEAEEEEVETEEEDEETKEEAVAKKPPAKKRGRRKKTTVDEG